MPKEIKMRNFKEYVILRDNDMSLAQDGRHPEDWNDQANSLLYTACKKFASKKPEALMGFLEDQGDDEIREIIKRVKAKKGGLNQDGKGLGNLTGDDMERIKTPDADRAGSPEEDGDEGSGGGGY